MSDCGGASGAAVERVPHAAGAAGERRHQGLEQVVRRALEDAGDALERAAADAEAVAAALDVAPALLGTDAREFRGPRLRQPVLFAKRPNERTTDVPDLVLIHVCLRVPAPVRLALQIEMMAHSP